MRRADPTSPYSSGRRRFAWTLACSALALLIGPSCVSTGVPLTSPVLHELVRLELDHDVIGTTWYSASADGDVPPVSTLMSALGREPSQVEHEKLQRAARKLIQFIVHDVVSADHWEAALSEFYSKNLQAIELREILDTYDDLERTDAGRRLQMLRIAFLHEEYPKRLIKSRLRALKMLDGSMLPALLVDEKFFADKRSYQSQSPHRGDIIAFKHPRILSKLYIRRIIGLPGETIAIRDKMVYVNDRILDERAYAHRIAAETRDASTNPRDSFGPVVVPQGSYYVLGDNRDQTPKGRFGSFVRSEKILGKVRIVYWSSDDGADHVRWDRIGLMLD